MHTQRTPATVMTSIGRLTEQKLRLLAWADDAGTSALEHILLQLGEDGLLILLGSGDSDYEQFINETQARHRNLIFINHYGEQIADTLYASGDLFLMPSSFEPCGISQMQAMRAGQPCLVHAVGGLRDTVADNVNGFHFGGSSAAEQAQNLVSRCAEVIALQRQQPQQWQTVRSAALDTRFLWSDSAAQYVQLLYRHREYQMHH